MPKSPAPKRRQRRHGDLPAGFLWRDGRPRWVPSPTRRKQGWRAIDLRDAWKSWLPRGAAIERAEEIARAVEAWAAGEPVPARFAAIAPAGATAAGASQASLNPRAIGTLLEAYFDSPKFKGGGKLKGLAPATQRDYRSKLSRFQEAVILSGGATPDAAKLAKLRGLDIDCLLPPPFDTPGDFVLEAAYEALRESAGEHMAYGTLACVSAWLAWCVKKKRIWPSNPAELVERQIPDGRIVVYDWPELVALVARADAVGLPSIGDAIVLAVDLSWSQQDILAMGWSQVSDDFHVKHRRIKTGVAGNPMLLAIGRDRLLRIRARWHDAKVRPVNVIVCDLPNVPPGQPWSASTFQHKFAEIRAHVAQALPGVAGKQFRDTRDTSITYCSEGGLTVDEICSRSLHEPTRAQAVLQKHYGAIRQGTSDEAARKLDEHFAKMGYSFAELLALPAPGS